MNNRREFVKKSSLLVAGSMGIGLVPKDMFKAAEENTIASKRQWKSLVGADPVIGDILLTDRDDQNLVIQAYRYVVENNSFKDIQSNVILLCYELVLKDSISIEGPFSITIFCFKLTTDRDVSIVCKGRKGKDAIKAEDGQVLGEGGKDGDNQYGNGINYEIGGQHAGDISIVASRFEIHSTLTLQSIGGEGGKGEDGGNGFKGKAGAAGRDGQTPGGNFEGEAGAKGGKGGPGGKGAIGGAGGNGGSCTIKVYSVEGATTSALDHSKFVLNSVPGAGGPGGKGGAGGQGGDGGIGGRKRTWHSGSGGGVHGGGGFEGYRLTKHRHPSGETGDVGDVGADGAQGSSGLNGNIGISTIDAAEVATHSTAAFAKVLLLKGESSYLNGDLALAADLFTMLSKYHPPLIDNATNTLYQRIQNYTFSSTAEVTEIVAKSNAYLAKMSLGLDFFGNSVNYVPRLRFDFLKNELNVLLQQATDFENSYKAFTETQKTIAEQVTELNSQRTALTQQRNAMAGKLQSKFSYTFNTLQKEITDLNLEIDKKIARLHKAEEKFKKALKERNKKKCGFGEVIACASVLVSIGTAVSSFGAGIAAGMKAIDTYNEMTAKSGGSFAETWNIVKNVGNASAEAAKHFSSASSAVDKVESGISKLFDEQRATLDTSLIEMEYKDFEVIINKYLEMKEAQAYKKEMRDFVNTINTRNSKRVELTNSILDIEILRSEIAQLENQLQRTSTMSVARNNMKSSSDVQLLFLNQYLIVKHQMLRLTYLLNKSLEFFVLKPQPMHYLDSSVSTIKANVINVSLNAINNTNALGSGLNQFRNARIVLKASDYPLQFSDFRTGNGNEHVMTFDIRFNEQGFAGEYSEIRAKNVRVFLPKVKASGEKVSMKLMHLGNSAFQTRSRQVENYMHEQVAITLDYYFTREQNLAYNEISYSNNITGTFENSSEKFTLVSPFANWRLSIRKDVNPSINLSKVKEVVLLFDFYAAPRS